MKRRRRNSLYIPGILAMLCVILCLIRISGGDDGRTESPEQKTESDLGMTDDSRDSAEDQGMEENASVEKIRVLLMTTGYTEALHDAVSLSADGGLILCYGGQEETWEQGTLTLAPDDGRFTDGKITVKPLVSGEEIRVESIRRGRGIPSYAGSIEIWTGEEGMAVINELSVEQYLCRVVPSEMPASYETEALKAQAVCARSYAYRQMAEYAYPEYQAHVNDSTEYQVYNNSLPAERASQAVKETEGQVIRFQGNIVPAYYYSTSCGRTTTMEAWGDPAGEGNAYLQSVRVSGDDGDYERALPWYHWRAEIPSEVLAGLVRDYTGQDPGTPENVSVTRRGPGDIALELTVAGTKATVTVETENHIRRALGGAGYQITRNDGQTVDSQQLLPSAFFTIEKKDHSYILEGGGYGHGIGMSQNGANEMAKCGKTYKEILSLFYQGVTIG